MHRQLWPCLPRQRKQQQQQQRNTSYRQISQGNPVWDVTASRDKYNASLLLPLLLIHLSLGVL